MFYKDVFHCENTMTKLLNKYSSRYGMNSMTRMQLIYMSKFVYQLEKGNSDKFKSSPSYKLYWSVKNDLEKTHQLKDIYDYIKMVSSLYVD